MEEGQTYLGDKNYDKALIEFQAAQIAARECDLHADSSKIAADLIQKVFAGLQRQRDEALDNEKKARQAEARAKKKPASRQSRP